MSVVPQSMLEPITTIAPVQAAIQQLVAQEIANYNTVINLRIATLTTADIKVATQVDGQSFTSAAALDSYLAQKAGNSTGGGASIPVVNAAPTVSDTTIDVTQVNVVVTQGTYTGGAVTSRQYRWIVAGVSQTSVWSLGLGNVAQAVGGTAPAANTALILEELAFYATSTVPVSNKSVALTLNAGAAVPQNTTAPTATGGVVNAGIWNNTPLSNSYEFNLYDGGQPSQGGLLLASFTGQPVQITPDYTAYAGKTLVWQVYATNATGKATTPAYTAPIVISGGLAPVQNAPIGFGYAATYPVGTAIPLDYGLLPGTSISDFWDNNPSATGFTVFMTMDDAPIAGGGANVISYTPPPGLELHRLSYYVTATNGSPTAVQSTPAGAITIVAQVGGGGGAAISRVGVSRLGGTTAAGVSITPTLPTGAQSSDMVIAACSNNSNSNTWNTPSGWTAIGTNSGIATPEGMNVAAFFKILGAGESNPTFTLTGADTKEVTLVAYRGATRVVAQAVTTNNASNASGFTATSPTVTTDAVNQIVLNLFDFDPTDSGNPVTLSGIPATATQISNFGWGGTDYAVQAILENAIAAAGATGTFPVTCTAPATATGWIARSIAIGV